MSRVICFLGITFHKYWNFHRVCLTSKITAIKKIINYLKDFIRADFNPLVYGYTLIFLIITFYFNFKYDFEDSVLDATLVNPWMGMFWHFCFFGFAYYGVVIPKLLLTKQFDKLGNKHFWIKSGLFIGLMGIAGGFAFHHDFLLGISNYSERYFLGKIFSNIRRIMLYTIPFFLIKNYYDKEMSGLFGLTTKNVNIKPYLWMLLIMLPLIMTASFIPAFLKQYPTFKFWIIEPVFGLEKWQMTAIYEFVYGMDFTFVELMFRGALVIGMVKILGKDAILPMAAVYGFLHFGKPLGEAVSSIFGGYILGIIAYYSRNIWGGVFIHMGIAYLMEFTALIQHWFKGTF
ncbi:MAG: hypothetical protein ACI81T_000340 [Bacteroidia bacterium]